jgi:Do/DeqQ family serine protease
MTRIALALAAFFSFFTAPLMAQPLRASIPASKAEITLSFAPVAKKASPSVVNVYGSRTEQQRNPMFDDPFFRQFFGRGGEPPPRVARSAGSGVVVDASGFVVTNNHVIEQMTELKVALADKREYEATLVIADPRSDLAVLKLKDAPRDLVAIDLGDADALEIGDLVLAIGNPFGLGQTVTQGIVSALARTQVGVSDYQSFIQTDAAINPGNSGGALVDMAGRLVGINTAIFSRSGGSHGVGFAIPVAMVKVVLASAKTGDTIVRRPWIGARFDNVTREIADSLRLPRPVGAIIVSVNKDSPAAAAGLKTGDVIVSVDGQEVEDADNFGYRYGIKPIGGKAQLGIIRDSKPLTVTVALSPAPKGAQDATEITGTSPFTGATVATISPSLLDELRVRTQLEGVIVTKVSETSVAARVGLRAGDVIVQVNDETIASPAALQDVSKKGARLWRITLERGGQVVQTILR